MSSNSRGSAGSGCSRSGSNRKGSLSKWCLLRNPDDIRGYRGVWRITRFYFIREEKTLTGNSSSNSSSNSDSDSGTGISGSMQQRQTARDY